MKLSRLETHDRLLQFKKEQTININQGIEDCRKINPLSVALQQKSHYIYIFAHPRTADDGVTKKMLWQPRLIKPLAQTNSYLFRLQSNTDIIEICWLIPPRETWPQYKKGNVTQSDWVLWSIDQYINNKKALESPFAEDISDEKARQIYKIVADDLDKDISREKFMKQLWVDNG